MTDTWTLAEIAARIREDGAFDLAVALRATAARIADNPDTSDPRSVLYDLAEAARSIAEAADQIVKEHCADRLDGPDAAVYRASISNINAGAGDLQAIANGWI